jgi:hypothetical protein
MNAQNQLIARLFAQNKPTFVAVQGYLSDTTQEVANYIINVGCSYGAARDRSIKMLGAFLEGAGLSDIQRLAGTEMLTSAVNNKDPETASAGSLANAETYTRIGSNMDVHNGTGELYLVGFVVGKRVTEPGTHKVVKSNDKTLAKKAINRELRLPTDKRRRFKFSKLSSVTMRGTTLVLQLAGDPGTELADNENTLIFG